MFEGRAFHVACERCTCRAAASAEPPGPFLVFVHVPKAGGSTIKNLLKAWSMLIGRPLAGCVCVARAPVGQASAAHARVCHWRLARRTQSARAWTHAASHMLRFPAVQQQPLGLGNVDMHACMRVLPLWQA